MQILTALESAFGGAPVVIPVEALAAQATQQKHSAAMEKIARDQGFRSAEEMLLWNAQREKKRAPQTIKGASKPAPKDGKQPVNPAAGGVSGIFDTISRALAGNK